ncbi:MAG: IS3 family transposase [Pseudonocardia sp.]|nr:IS3 family transposase [Pseudonocardia sp.]
MIVDYIDRNKATFGVEPICSVLKEADVPIAPSTYYASKTRPPSARSVTDAETLTAIRQTHADNFGVYGARKVWAALRREGGVTGRAVARCTVERLMRADGLRGVSRVVAPRITVRSQTPDHRPDLVDREFAAPAQDHLWVADIERHEALLNRVEVGDLHRRVVAAAR